MEEQQITLKSVPLYFNKFLSSLDVKAMSTRQVGAYFLLLINSIDQVTPGYLHTDEVGLRNIVKLNDKQWQEDRNRVLKKFKHNDLGYHNEAMVKAIQEQIDNIERDKNANKIVGANDKADFTLHGNSGLHPLQEYIENFFTNVKKIHSQLTHRQCEKLLKECKFSDSLIISKLIKLENTFGAHNRYTSVFLTLKDWCERELKK